ncbi:unnamed protein product, partial [Allacma fusca]
DNSGDIHILEKKGKFIDLGKLLVIYPDPPPENFSGRRRRQA